MATVSFPRSAPGWLALLLSGFCAQAQAGKNLLDNPGFEQRDGNPKEAIPHWLSRSDSAGTATLQTGDAHAGQQCAALAASTALEQQILNLPSGAYLARCWVKSESEQPVTLLLQNPDRPWAAYTYAELKVPKNQWTRLETFCALDEDGSLMLTIGGMSAEFRKYHGTAGELKTPILIDDCELTRFDQRPSVASTVWDPGTDRATFDGPAQNRGVVVDSSSHTFKGTAMFQDRHLAGAVQLSDGGLSLFSLESGTPQSRGVIAPKPAFAGATCGVVRSGDKTGLEVKAADGSRSYIAWLAANGVLEIEARQVPQFEIADCRLRYGLLPSFVGTDLCFAPAKLASAEEVNLPFSPWFVGLRDGQNSMLVVVSKSGSQTTSLALNGEGKDRLFDRMKISTEKAGFALSFVEHVNLWRNIALNEDWLGEYVPLDWREPFPARWMAQFQVTTGGKPAFRTPYMQYSFPLARTKTRMWGVWFEDWNHYPFFFDGPQCVAHFEKTFVPNGEALLYMLEPAAADLYSPVEIVQQVLGKERAAALFDLDGNALRRLKYSTPNQFMFDRPVCATTTRLSQIKKEDKPTVGVQLATHLYEFIREIRGRVDQYAAFFQELNGYLSTQKQSHPELTAYVAELDKLVAEAQAKTQDIYATPLSAVEKKTESMKQLLREGKGDGFDCGTLDVRSPAGAQDDLCRRYNRLVLRLEQTAAFNGGNSPEKARIASHICEESEKVLRQPTRWEPRRTLYFFEP